MRIRLLPLVIPGLILLIWQLSGEFGWISSRLLPTPISVVRAGWRLSLSGELFKHLLISFQRAASGFMIGGSIGLTLGILTGASRFAESLFDGSMQMLRTLPHLALISLVILWFGIGESAKIFLVALGVLFPIYVNTHHGVRHVDPALIEMARVYRISRVNLFRRILIPGAMPSILVGIRYSLGVMWLTLIVAETIAATSGIGYLAMNAREFLQTDVVMLCILLYATLGKLADSIARKLERHLLPWHPAHAPELPIRQAGRK